MDLRKLSTFFVLFLLAACAPSSYIGNIPSGDGGKAMSQYGDTPPTSFAYSLNDGYYFIGTNEYSGVVTITIRLSRKSNVKLTSGEALIGNEPRNLQRFTFPSLEFKPPYNADCGISKFLGCNNFYTYTTWVKFESADKVKVPTELGEKLIIIAPEVTIDGETFKPKIVHFVRGNDTYMSPLNS
jgi:hypothetical protein